MEKKRQYIIPETIVYKVESTQWLLSLSLDKGVGGGGPGIGEAPALLDIDEGFEDTEEENQFFHDYGWE